MHQPVITAADRMMMGRCVELAKTARALGELPFACVIARGHETLAEAVNEVARQGDVTRHAELVAISRAQRVMGGKKLKGCTLYTTVEPCPMCSLPIRETKISRVIFALRSPLMGGSSRWDVLGDETVGLAMPEYFGKPPEIIAGLMEQEVEQVWREWNPLVWKIIKSRGCFGRNPALDGQ